MSAEWQIVRIEDIAAKRPSAMATGPFGSSISAKYFQNEGVPVIRGSNLSADIQTKLDDSGLVFVSKEKAREFDRCLVGKGDLVFTCWGTINQVGLVDRDAAYERYIISNKQMKLTVDELRVDPRFVYYVFSGPEKQAEIIDNGIGSSVPGFNLGQLRKHELLLPPLREQRAIADTLDLFTNRITLLRETNATLEAIAQALFKSWFVDFDPARAKAEGRQPEGMDAATAALFPDSFEESELGLVPRGWRNSTLDGVSDVGIGKTPPRKEAHWFSENAADVRWVSIRDMGCSGTFLMETSEYLTADAVSRFNVRVAPDNTVLLSFKMTIGRVAITYGEMTTNEAIAHCKVADQSPISSEYIYLYLRQFDYSTLSSTSSIADAVNSKTVKGIPILVPEAEVVAAFQKAVSVIFARIKNIQEQAQTLTQLRDTLLPRLISGQLRLPEAESVIKEVC